MAIGAYCPTCGHSIAAEWIPDNDLIPKGWIDTGHGIMGGPCPHCNILEERSKEMDLELGELIPL